MKRMVAGKRGHYVTKLPCEQNIWTAAALNCKLHIANWVPGQEAGLELCMKCAGEKRRRCGHF